MSRNSDQYISTFSGRKFWALDPRPEDVCIADIAHALANNCRWGGHCREFFSVAQHSLMVSSLLPAEFQFCGLMHDASEAYLLDMPRPIKRQMPEYSQVELRLMTCIAVKYSFEWPMPEIVKAADDLVLYLEKKWLFDSSGIEVLSDRAIDFFFERNYDGENFYDKSALPCFMTPADAKANFIRRFNELCR